MPQTAQRRTQAERSRAMRKRLQHATLQCLATHGYAGTTVSAIVKQARVSRGAQLHHYASKNELIHDAAAALMRQMYRKLGEVLLANPQVENRLAALVHSAWDELYVTLQYTALQELILASRHDKALAAMLQTLAQEFLQHIHTAAQHYFEPAEGAVMSVDEVFVHLQWQLRGMAEDLKLAPDAATLRGYLQGFTRLLATQLRAKANVTTAPPRPQSAG